MTLTTRLSLFFQGMLAIVLVAFSACLFFAVRAYLFHETDDSLKAALNTLVAAIEVVPEGVEWEPSERNLSFRNGPLGQEVRWVLIDVRGQTIDSSSSLDKNEPIWTAVQSQPRTESPRERTIAAAGGWQIAQQWMRGRRLHPELEYHPDTDFKFPAIGVTVAISLQPVYSSLRLLAIALAGITLAFWFVALAIGRAVCRRALAPISQLAGVAERMDATHMHHRLPTVNTADELEQLTCAFNGLLDRLEEAFTRQRRFTGDASHQLRTPLTAIQGQVEVALRRDRSPAEYRETLRLVQKRAAHLHVIVESLLFLARSDGDAQLAGLKPVELASWLAKYLDNWSGHPRYPDLQYSQPEGEYRLNAQPVLLGQLIDILLDNASKYSPPGSPIQLRLARGEGQISLEVEDFGSGMETSELLHIYEPFCRSPDARRRGIAGIGLGLTIASRLTRLFGGQIDCTSHPGRGTTFLLRFPEAPAAGADSPLSREEPESASPRRADNLRTNQQAELSSAG